jgi:antitoxin Phd
VPVGARWQLQDAKNRFSEVVDRALEAGPQTVTRRGEPVVVVVSVETWNRLVEAPPSLKAYLRSAPGPLEVPRDDPERADWLA